MNFEPEPFWAEAIAPLDEEEVDAVVGDNRFVEQLVQRQTRDLTRDTFEQNPDKVSPVQRIKFSAPPDWLGLESRVPRREIPEFD